MSLNKDVLLGIRPGIPSDVRAKLIVPALTALFAYPPWEVPSDDTPLSLAFCFHQPASITETGQKHINSTSRARYIAKTLEDMDVGARRESVDDWVLGKPREHDSILYDHMEGLSAYTSFIITSPATSMEKVP